MAKVVGDCLSRIFNCLSGGVDYLKMLGENLFPDFWQIGAPSGVACVVEFMNLLDENMICVSLCDVLWERVFVSKFKFVIH